MVPRTALLSCGNVHPTDDYDDDDDDDDDDMMPVERSTCSVEGSGK